MPITTIQKITTKKGIIQYISTVPKEVIKMAEWNKGTILYWEKQGKAYLVKEMPKVDQS